MDEAKKSEPNEPNAMSVASVDAEGRPNVRMVLLKDAEKGGFVFFTNYESAKGVELVGQPHAALCFHWKSLGKQVRVRGTVEQVSAEESRRLFRDARQGQPDRRLGVGAVAAHGRPLGVRKRDREIRRANTRSPRFRGRRIGRASA